MLEISDAERKRKRNEHVLKWRDRNPEEHRRRQKIYQKRWLAKNPDHGKKWRTENRLGTFEKKIIELLNSARARAKKKGIEFTITYKDFMAVSHCPLLGILLDFSTKGRGGKNNSPSIDRIDPTKGYVPGNVWVISYRANRIKSDATVDELEMILNNLRALTNA